MTKAIQFAGELLVFNMLGSAITGGAAWGTRYVSQIATQDILPAAMTGALGNTTAMLLVHVTQKFKNEITNYFLPSTRNREQAEDNAFTFSLLFCMGIGFLASSVATPTLATLAGRNISYRAATLFGLLNTITIVPQILVLEKLFPNKD